MFTVALTVTPLTTKRALAGQETHANLILVSCYVVLWSCLTLAQLSGGALASQAVGPGFNSKHELRFCPFPGKS